jgi:oxalate decarboxylase/phosphoglucose isomerase-like protein (cupin superfamily)
LFSSFSYAQCLPSRFKKDLIRAASPNASDRVALDDMKRVLINIGAEDKLSPGEMKVIFDEHGNGTGEIDVVNLIKII